MPRVEVSVDLGRNQIGHARTVTSNDQEFVIIGDLVHGDIGECGHNLLLRGKVGALLELKVANGSGERKVAVDAAKVDEAAGCGDSRLLA